MLSQTELADRLAVHYDSGHEELQRSGESTWESAGLLLEVTEEQIGGGQVLGSVLSNRSGAPVFLERLEALRFPVAARDEEVRYLRFGFNMPGDPTFFGVLCGPRAAVPCPIAPHGGADDQDLRVTANTAMALRRASNGEVVVVGAGSFHLAEGTVILELPL